MPIGQSKEMAEKVDGNQRYDTVVASMKPTAQQQSRIPVLSRASKRQSVFAALSERHELALRRSYRRSFSKSGVGAAFCWASLVSKPLTVQAVPVVGIVFVRDYLDYNLLCTYNRSGRESGTQDRL